MSRWFQQIKTLFVRDRIKMQDDARDANQSAEISFMDNEAASMYYVTTGALASNALYVTSDLFIKNGNLKIRNESLGISWTVGIYVVEGSPEGSLVANVGSMALRRDGGAGTVLYVKESGLGNTGWVAK